VLLKMLETADVLLENFKPGTLDKMGHRQRCLRAKFLNSCTADLRLRPDGRAVAIRYDAIIQARRHDRLPPARPRSGPMRIGVPLVDITTGFTPRSAF